MKTPVLSVDDCLFSFEWWVFTDWIIEVYLFCESRRRFEHNILTKLSVQYSVTKSLVRREKQSLWRGSKSWVEVRSPVRRRPRMFLMICSDVVKYAYYNMLSHEWKELRWDSTFLIKQYFGCYKDIFAFTVFFDNSFHHFNQNIKLILPF